MNDWKIIPTIVFTTVLIFGAGVFTGGMLVDYVKQPHAKPFKRTAATPIAANVPVVTNAVAPPGRPAKAPEILNKDFLQRLDGDLRLTKEQHEAVQKIIEDGQNSVRKAVQDARLEIREVLTPAQRQAFDELVKRPFRRSLFGTNAPANFVPVPAIPATNAP